MTETRTCRDPNKTAFSWACPPGLSSQKTYNKKHGTLLTQEEGRRRTPMRRSLPEGQKQEGAPKRWPPRAPHAQQPPLQQQQQAGRTLHACCLSEGDGTHSHE
jgi:hypothetical protein